MNIFDNACVWFTVFCFEIEYLASDHSIHRASGASDLLHNVNAGFGRAPQFAQDFVGIRLQCIAGQNCNGFTENDMAGRLSPSQVVVVERRQIVVDERISVQHFQRAAPFAPLPCTAPGAAACRRQRRYAAWLCGSTQASASRAEGDGRESSRSARSRKPESP